MAAVLNMAEGAAPGTPGAGTHNLYVDTSHDWHILDDEGNDHTLATTDYQFDTASLADEAVTNAKLAQMAESTIKGRAAGAGTGAVVDLTAAQVVTLLTDELADVLDAEFTPAGDASWTTLTVGAGFTAPASYPAGYTLAVPAYRKVSGRIQLRGCAAAALAGTQTLGTLPEGYRPEYDCIFSIQFVTSGSTYGTVRAIVKTDGSIVASPVSPNYVYHFDPVSFVPA